MTRSSLVSFTKASLLLQCICNPASNCKSGTTTALVQYCHISIIASARSSTCCDVSSPAAAAASSRQQQEVLKRLLLLLLLLVDSSSSRRCWQGINPQQHSWQSAATSTCPSAAVAVMASQLEAGRAACCTQAVARVDVDTQQAGRAFQELRHTLICQHPAAPQVKGLKRWSTGQPHQRVITQAGAQR